MFYSPVNFRIFRPVFFQPGQKDTFLLKTISKRIRKHRSRLQYET